MRLRSLAPLLVLTALACHPRSEGGETPGTGSSPGDAQPGTDGERATEPQRPPGVIFRSELVRATQGGNAPYLLGQLGPEAYSPQGRFEGWIITRLWPGDPDLCAPGCDLRVGDVILSVNGSKLETPEQLSNLLANIETLERLEVTGIRDGEFFERSYPIVAE